MKIGDEVYVHGYIDEIRQDIIIIRNKGGYFGTISSEVEDEPFDKDTNVRSKDCETCELYGTGCGIPCDYEPETEPMKTADYCDICKRDMCEVCVVADATNPYCVPSHYEIRHESKTKPHHSGEVTEMVEPQEWWLTENSLDDFRSGFIHGYAQAKHEYEQKDELQTEYPCNTCTNKGDHDGECSNCIVDSEPIRWKTPSHYKSKDEPQKSCSTCGYSPQTPSCDTCEGYSNWWSLEGEPQTERNE